MERALRAYAVIDISRALDRQVRKLLLAADRKPRQGSKALSFPLWIEKGRCVSPGGSMMIEFDIPSGATVTLAVATPPVLWRSEKTVALSGRSLHLQKARPVSDAFIAPTMAAQIRFWPHALAASMARTLTLRAAPDAMLTQWAQSQLMQVEFLVSDGANFGLSPYITALADAERAGFAGRVGAGIADLLMNSLGYVWRDNAMCLSVDLDPHADFVYAGGPVAGHGVVLAEAHGSFAQSVSDSRIRGESRRKYLRQVKPYIATQCQHGEVIHGYSVAFGSNPSNAGSYLYVAETKIPKSKGKPNQPAPQSDTGGTGIVPTSLALASHRSNFLLMGATQVVAWIDWLRGSGERPSEDSVTTFLTIELSGRRFLAAAEYFFPYFRSRFLFDELELSRAPMHWEEFARWRDRVRSGQMNVFAMDEWAAKSFLLSLSTLIRGTRDRLPAMLNLPTIEPVGLSIEPDGGREGGLRYPVVQFRDGLALLGGLPRSPAPATRHWSPLRGFDVH